VIGLMISNSVVASQLTRRWSGQLGDLGAEFELVDCRST